MDTTQEQPSPQLDKDNEVTTHSQENESNTTVNTVNEYESQNSASTEEYTPRSTTGGRENVRREGYGDRDYRKSDFGTDKNFRKSSRYKKYDKIAAKKLDIDYKKPEILKQFLTERGKILSRLITGNSRKNQHRLTQEVKRARYIGFLPSS